MATFNLSNRVKIVNTSPNVDSDYGPYASVSAATTALPLALRIAGKTIGVYVGTSVVEYWWKDDSTLSSDPIIKEGEQNLQSVTTKGATTTTSITAASFIKNSSTGTNILLDDGNTIPISSIDGTVTSVGVSMPSAFTVTNSPVNTSGTIAVTGAGLASQYIRGDGQLASFPDIAGGGGGQVYYCNGGTSQGTIGGSAFYQISTGAILLTGVDFTSGTVNNVAFANFITDIGKPTQEVVPAGVWIFQCYLSASATNSLEVYATVEIYDGSTFNVLATSLVEVLTGGTSIDLYTFTCAVPEYDPLVTADRIAIRFYPSNLSGGNTITLHTQDSHLSSIQTTFTTGLASLNGLTSASQLFAKGTSGNDFNIDSSSATHTFNIPDASSTSGRRGLLIADDWITFNSKEPAITIGTTAQYWRGDKSFHTLNTLAVPELTNLYYTDSRSRLALSFIAGSGAYDNTTGLITIPTNNNQITNGSAYISLTSLSVTAPLNYNNINGAFTISQATTSIDGYLNSTDWNTFNNKEGAITAGTSLQYYRGDKTFQTLNTTAVVEGTNLYYTQARFDTAFIAKSTTNLTEGTNLYYLNSRARTALSFAAGSGAYNDTTGIITIPTNNTQIINGSNYITLGSLSSTATGLTYTNTTGVFSLTSGYLIPTSASYNNTNWDIAYTDRNNWDGGTTGLNASTGRISLGANTIGSSVFTSTNPSAITFLQANANNTVSWLDAASFRTAIGAGSVTSVAALTLTSAVGTDLTSSVANGTTTPVITLNVPDAGPLARGVVTTGIQIFAGAKTFSGVATFGTIKSTIFGSLELVGTSSDGSLMSLNTDYGYPSLTEIQYVKDVTSNIQTQLNYDAGATQRGAITTGVQIIAGNKTFSGETTTLNNTVISDGYWLTFLDGSGPIYTSRVTTNALSGDRVVAFPNASGTIALTSDITPSLARIGNGTAQWQVPVTTNPSTYAPNWITSINLYGSAGLNSLSFAGQTGFVKMTTANTFALDPITNYATIASPTFTGTPSLTTTPTAGDNTTKLASTAFVKTAIDSQVYNITMGTGGVSFTTADVTSAPTGSYSQNGRNVMIDNGTYSITITCSISAPADFIASYTKLGLGPTTITFQPSSGSANLTILGSTAILTGNPGSTALLTRNGAGMYYVQVNNL